MGSLRNLTNFEYSVHLVLSPSDKANMYIHDTLKATYHIPLDSIFEVKSKRDFSQMLELVNVQPYLADKWMFEIEYDKVKSILKKQQGLLESQTSVFVIKVKNYREFKEAKDFIKKCNDLYLPFMRKDDIMYILNGYELSGKLMQFVCTSYSKDPEGIFTLKEQLEQGTVIETQRDVVKLLGASQGSVASFIMLLLAKPPQTKKGFSMAMRKRMQTMCDLSDAYGVRTFRNYLSSTVYDMVQLKQLYMQGVIYDRVKDLPESFDEAKLSKYNFYLDRIENEISYEQLIRLYCILQEPENRIWHSSQNAIEFLYKYYGGVCNGIISEL